MSLIYSSTTKLNDESTFTFFKDTDLEITAKIYWKSNKVDYIELTPDSSSGINYEIIHINECPHRSSSPRFYMVHIYAHANAKDKETFTATASNHLKHIDLSSANDTALFRFSVSPAIVDPNDPGFSPCAFYEPDPKTKDGSIIVSI